MLPYQMTYPEMVSTFRAFLGKKIDTPWLVCNVSLRVFVLSSAKMDDPPATLVLDHSIGKGYHTTSSYRALPKGSGWHVL